MEDHKISEHFMRSEIECRHCHKAGPYAVNVKKLLALLEKIREAVKRPVNLTCAYRCPVHNAAVGGVPNSYHTQGMAADIYVEGMGVEELAHIAEKCGAGGVGRYFAKCFVHVDVGPYNRWTE